MNNLPKKIGIPLNVIWIPNAKSDNQATIDIQNRFILIYNTKEEDAWNSLIHEILEFRLRDILNPYKKLINNLIAFIKDQIYF